MTSLVHRCSRASGNWRLYPTKQGTHQCNDVFEFPWGPWDFANKAQDRMHSTVHMRNFGMTRIVIERCCMLVELTASTSEDMWSLYRDNTQTHRRDEEEVSSASAKILVTSAHNANLRFKSSVNRMNYFICGEFISERDFSINPSATQHRLLPSVFITTCKMSEPYEHAYRHQHLQETYENMKKVKLLVYLVSNDWTVIMYFGAQWGNK